MVMVAEPHFSMSKFNEYSGLCKTENLIRNTILGFVPNCKIKFPNTVDLKIPEFRDTTYRNDEAKSKIP